MAGSVWRKRQWLLQRGADLKRRRETSPETAARRHRSGQAASAAETTPATSGGRQGRTLFQPGTGVGGVTILARLPHGSRVRDHCCGKVATLSPSQLKARRTRPATQCHACAARAALTPTRTFRHDDELPVHPRTLAPSTAYLLAIQARAAIILRQRDQP